MAALNARKMAFAPLRGPFTHDGINEFLRALAVGRGRTETTRNKDLPKIEKTEPWDGKDAKVRRVFAALLPNRPHFLFQESRNYS